MLAADVHAIPTYVVILAVMTAVWCAAGHVLVNNRVIGDHMRRYGHVLLPFVIIGLGIMILRNALPLFQWTAACGRIRRSDRRRRSIRAAS